MTLSEKSHQNLSDCIQFLFKKRFTLIEKVIISREKMRNSGIYVYMMRKRILRKGFLIQAAIPVNIY